MAAFAAIAAKRRLRDALQGGVFLFRPSPAIEHGDQVVVHPFLPPQPGRDCVFLQEAGDGQMLALVKRLVKATASSWRVRQFNPAKEFDLPKSNVGQGADDHGEADWPSAYMASLVEDTLRTDIALNPKVRALLQEIRVDLLELNTD
jgi:hypothetical protein